MLGLKWGYTILGGKYIFLTIYANQRVLVMKFGEYKSPLMIYIPQINLCIEYELTACGL